MIYGNERTIHYYFVKDEDIMRTTPIKILHLELSDSVGGIESFLYNIYREIDRKRFHFDFITRFDKPGKGKELKSLGASIYKVSSLNQPYKYMSDLEKVLNYGYDVVHIHKNSAANLLPFMVLKKFPEIKVFVHSHNTKPSVGTISSVFHFCNRRKMYRLAEKHFACSKAAGDWLYGKKANYKVLNNGISTANYKFDINKREKKRKELGILSSTFVVGNIGRFTKQKNQERLVSIFFNILKMNNNSKLLLVGDGELKNNIMQEAHELGIDQSIMFLGIRDDINELMMAMDVFVMPSFYEGLPIVGIESQCSGLNVFLSDTISKETEISTGVKWFNLKNDDKEIALSIVNDRLLTYSERISRCEEVQRAGFDIQITTKELENYYEQ